jgi:hypothetical protein
MTRVESLRGFFLQLKDAGVKLTVITKGNVGAVRCLLAQEGLLDLFEKVFGMVGDATYGLSEYDQAHREPSEYEGTPDAQLLGAKADLIRSLMLSEGLTEAQALLVEDDHAEVESVQGVCQGFFVSARKGITDTEMASILQMAGAPSMPKHPTEETPVAKTNGAQAAELHVLDTKSEDTKYDRDQFTESSPTAPTETQPVCLETIENHPSAAPASGKLEIEEPSPSPAAAAAATGSQQSLAAAPESDTQPVISESKDSLQAPAGASEKLEIQEPNPSAAAASVPTPAVTVNTGTSLEVGTFVQAKYTDGSFHRAKILQIKKDGKKNIKVRWDGYGQKYDSWIDLSGIKTETPSNSRG